MAISKILIASLLISQLLVLNLVQASQETEEARDSSYAPKPKIDCGVRCGERCALSSRPNLCKRACGTCCKRCSCVPPGTYGNHQLCPCYANMTTRGGRPKCP